MRPDRENFIWFQLNMELSCWCGLFGIHHIDTKHWILYGKFKFFAARQQPATAPSPPSLKRNNSGAPASRPSIVVVSPISRKDSFKCYFDLFCLASLHGGTTGFKFLEGAPFFLGGSIHNAGLPKMFVPFDISQTNFLTNLNSHQNLFWGEGWVISPCTVGHNFHDTWKSHKL